MKQDTKVAVVLLSNAAEAELTVALSLITNVSCGLGVSLKETHNPY